MQILPPSFPGVILKHQVWILVWFSCVVQWIDPSQQKG